MHLSSCLSQGKVFNHWDRFHELIETGECLPVTIQLDPTNQCNRNCETCSGNRIDSGAELSFEVMRDIIDQTKSFCRGIIFTGGGEPLCNDNTVDAIHYAKQQGIDVALVTNGDLLDETSAKALVADCSYRVIMSEHKYEDMWEKGEKRAGYPECLSDWIRTVIAADGRVYADCHTGGLKEFCSGDLDRDDFMKIWKSKRRNSVQKNKLKEKRCHAMSYHDPLDKFLWETKQQCDKGVHKNFL